MSVQIRKKLNIHITKINMPCLSSLQNLAVKQMSTAIFPLIYMTSLELHSSREIFLALKTEIVLIVFKLFSVFLLREKN